MSTNVIVGTNSVDLFDRPGFNHAACRNLLAAVLHQAVRECKPGNQAYHWLMGPDAARYAELLGIQPEVFREGLQRRIDGAQA